MYKVTKVIDGFSTAFRQWKSKTHCSFIHGYALEFEFEFACSQRDERGWVLDFGSLKELKQVLIDQFDHTTVISQDDPHLEQFYLLDQNKIIDMRVMDTIGCESFAEWAAHEAIRQLRKMCIEDRVWVSAVTVHEHGKNSATYVPDNQPQ